MYLDGFVVPVPRDRKDAYFEMAKKMAPLFHEHGLVQQVECWGDDLPEGKRTDFFRAVQAEQGENVVFSWMLWPDKATRDRGWEKIMADERMKPPADMPFDAKRMFFGGFEVMIDTARA